MEEELEVLSSLYGNDCVISVLNDTSETCIDLTLRPGGSADCTTSFVEMSIRVYLISGYPEIPIIRHDVYRTCGLSDDGKELRSYITQFLTNSAYNMEMMVLELCMHIIEYLDLHNSAECAICLDPLIITSANDILSLRTQCYHLFHVNCISKWAAIYFVNQDKTKEMKEEARDTVRMKNIQGDYKTEQSQLIKIENELVLITRNIDDIKQRLIRLDMIKNTIPSKGKANDTIVMDNTYDDTEDDRISLNKKMMDLNNSFSNTENKRKKQLLK
jgi:hypothetical protein